MNTDARISVGLAGHPKTKKLHRRIGDAGCWRLICLWLWVAQNKPDGDLVGMTDEDIEIAADWTGEQDAFVRALVDVRFLDGEPGARQMHDWADHNPWVASSRGRSDIARENASKKWGSPLDRENKKNRSERLAQARQKGTHTAEEWHLMRAVCGETCLRCGQGGLELVKDHIVPIYKGGSDGIENLQPLCRGCNASKGPDCSDLRPADWHKRLQNACKTPAEFGRNACATPAVRSMTPAPSPSPSPSPSPIPTPSPSPSPSPTDPRARAYPPEFVAVWEAKPAREGGDDKARAAKNFSVAVQAGHDPESILAGVKRYASYCTATNRVGTQYAMKLANFVSLEHDPPYWMQDWQHTGEQASAVQAQLNRGSAAAGNPDEQRDYNRIPADFWDGSPASGAVAAGHAAADAGGTVRRA